MKKYFLSKTGRESRQKFRSVPFCFNEYNNLKFEFLKRFREGWPLDSQDPSIFDKIDRERERERRREKAISLCGTVSRTELRGQEVTNSKFRCVVPKRGFRLQEVWPHMRRNGPSDLRPSAPYPPLLLTSLSPFHL